MAADGQVVIDVVADSSEFDSAVSSLGKSTQQSLGNAIKGSFIGNLFANAFSKAAGVIASSMDSAISRVDTLKNFPKVMQSLGYSMDDASASVSKMSDHLTGLPTRLDAMTSSVQQIVPTVKDVGKATDIMLAFNDACLAGGASTQVQEAAVTQFAQALAKGKPEMEDWRSIQTAMPGQLDQVAKSMLGASASSNDLYEALKSGDVTMEDFCDTLVRLDTEGGEGFASFAEQAKSGTAGIATSFSNLQNSVVKGLANILDAVGSENIVGVMEGANKQITALFKAVSGGVSGAMPTVKQLGSAIAAMGSQIVVGLAGFAGFKTAGTAVANMASRLGQLEKGASAASKASAVLGKSISPVGVAVTVAAVAVGLIAGAVSDYATKTQNAEKATSGLSDAASRLSSLDSYSGSIESVGTQAGFTALSVDELNKKLAEQADSMNESASSAESQIGKLNGAMSTIQQYAGQTDLTTQQQGKLEAALKVVNDELGTTISSSDVATGSWTDQSGAVKNLTSDLEALVEQKQKQIKLDALQSQASTAWDNYSAACDTAAKAQSDYNSACDEYIRWATESQHMTREQAQSHIDNGTAVVKERQELEKANASMSSAEGAYNSITDAIGDATRATSEGADAYDKWGNSLSQYTSSLLNVATDSSNGLGMLKEDLRSLGASTEDLGKLTDEQMQSLASSYDGTAQSIVGKLAEMGVSMDEAKVKAQEAASGIKSSLEQADGLGDKFGELGIDMDSFAQQCANAGLSAEDFSGVSSEAFAQLYEACGGNLQAMIAQIASYNSTPLVDKDGNVNVTDNALVDANGHIMTYNGTQLYDKTAGAYVDSATVVDSTGNVWAWNGTALVSKDADATITGNAVTGDAQGQADQANAAVQRLSGKTVTAQVEGNASDGSAATNIWNTVSAIGNLAGKTIDVVTNKITNLFENRNAKGGIRPHAAGGFVPRYHANGAIATKAVPLDIVGEDGAEAIVPLTNRRYSLPFAKLIAEQVVELADWGGDIDELRAQQALDQASQAAVLGAVFLQGIAQVVSRLDGIDQRLARIEEKMDRGTGISINGREFGRLVRESI